MQRPFRLRAIPVVLGRLAADLPGGSFAFVMATGIVSIAAALNGIELIAISLFAVNIFAFAMLSLLLVLRLRCHPAGFLAELRDHRRAPSLLTIVAGTCVLGNQVSLLTAHQQVAAVLWIGAAIVWLALSYCPFVLTVKPAKPLLEGGLDGSWLLIVVAPEALAIAATRAVRSWTPEPLALASLCLFALGSTFYLILLTLIVYRWLFRPMRPDQFASSYWINMGAAAITALAGARLLPHLGADPALRQARGFVEGDTVLFWSLATWWIPLLCGLTLWRWLAGTKARGYRLEHWSIVFPLGMYTTASWNFAHVIGPSMLATVPRVFVWVAILAWCLTFAGMLRQLGGWHRDPVVPTGPETGG
jgi:tellurite resistance protein TehA-like permease